MKNKRGAGRKSKITNADLESVRKRIENGEKVSALAVEYGISRQALYKKLSQPIDVPIVLDYVIDGQCKTRIEIDVTNERLRIENYAVRLSERAFGINANPSWDDLMELFEREYFESNGVNFDGNEKTIVAVDKWNNKFNLLDIVNNGTHLKMSTDVQGIKIPEFEFTKKDLMYLRTGTDGYQMKAVSIDRKWFVKSQAIMSGVIMDDWAVELIACDICKQLDIPCVEQLECTFVYGDRKLKAVYSKNFELDNYSFISFETLLERIGTSSREDEFIHLNAIDKLKWCAHKLSIAGNIDLQKTTKYMIDLALLDCLVGNVDRHTRNFGLFFNSATKEYEIPLIFDNGMGLFEHDSYKKSYTSFDSAMMNVYIAPYGEDPFDMLEMLFDEFNIDRCYPMLKDVEYHSNWITPYASEYIGRIKDYVRSKMDS